MDEGARQLLEAIEATPSDDDPRLVYADLLLSAGDPLGELIVAQLEQAQQQRDPALNRRVAELISAHQSEVLGDLPVSKPVFRRGFVEGLELSAPDFASIGDQVFARFPLLRELTIWLEGHPDTDTLLASPLLGRLRSLDLRYGRNCTFETLAANPALAQLERLALTHCNLQVASCTMLASSPHLASLHTLEVGLNDIGAAGLGELALASFAPRLRTLILKKAGVKREAIPSLPRFAALERLELDYNGLDLPAIEFLAEQQLPQLLALALRGDRLGAPLVPALAPFRLTQLDLDGQHIGDVGVAALAELALEQLEVLQLTSNRLTLRGVKQLFALQLPALRRLNLRRNDVGRGSAKLFARKFVDARIELDGAVLTPGR